MQLIGPYDHIKGLPAPNPRAQRNAKKMAKRGATWFHISKEPQYVFDGYGRANFVGFTAGKTYRKPKDV